MLHKLDLVALAEQIELPYQPVLLASMGRLEASLFICEGPKSWFRHVAHDELMLVLEGVITLDGPDGKLVVGEGEVAEAPRDVRHHANSGMRSTVALFKVEEEPTNTNGHQGPLGSSRARLVKTNIDARVREAEPFDWLPAGTAGDFATHGTRLVGRSAPYRVGAGSLAIIVYRGVLDYELGEESGSLVGSQMMVLPQGTEVCLSSENGATVVALSRKGDDLPVRARSSGGFVDAER